MREPFNSLSAYLVIPVFGFANAGVPFPGLGFDPFSGPSRSEPRLAVPRRAGGVCLTAWAAIRRRLADRPEEQRPYGRIAWTAPKSSKTIANDWNRNRAYAARNAGRQGAGEEDEGDRPGEENKAPERLTMRVP